MLPYPNFYSFLLYIEALKEELTFCIECFYCKIIKFAFALTPQSCLQQISILGRTHTVTLSRVWRHLLFLMYQQHFFLIGRVAWTLFEYDFLNIEPRHLRTYQVE